VADGAASDAGSVAAQLRHHGYSRAEYASAFESLTRRGWLAPAEPPEHRPTETGRAVRQAVDRSTDAAFYTPWS
jgi:hypothetical protein